MGTLLAACGARCQAQRLRSHSGNSPPTLPVVTDDLLYLQQHFLPRNGQLLSPADEVSTVQARFSPVMFT